LIAAAVSPPPAIDVNNFFWVFILINFAISLLPLAKKSLSKNPSGPFHSRVFDELIILPIFFIVLAPISKIISLDSISDKLLFFPAIFSLAETITSSGIISLQLFS